MTARPRVDPEHIGPTDDGAHLRIEWKDGTVSEYAPRALRLACPCAGCVEEMTGVRILRPEDVDPRVYPTAIHYVGRYALQFVWSDGHSTGIYTYEHLRKLWDDGEAGITDRTEIQETPNGETGEGDAMGEGAREGRAMEGDPVAEEEPEGGATKD